MTFVAGMPRPFHCGEFFRPAAFSVELLAQRLHVALQRDDLLSHRLQVASDSKTTTATSETTEMAIQQLRLAADDLDGLEQTITICQPAIMDRQPISGLPIHPAQCHSANRRKTSEPLVPPKPKELEMATSMARGFASCGTKSRSQPSSGSSRLMVGGAT